MDWSRALIYFGIFLILVGAVVNVFPGALTWFGKLPGDIRVQGEKGSLFIPITSMIIVSIITSIGVRVLYKLFPPEY